MADEGLYGKYHVRRADHKPMGWCFVLELSDPIAREALHLYSKRARETGKTRLAIDLDKVLRDWATSPETFYDKHV